MHFLQTLMAGASVLKMQKGGRLNLHWSHKQTASAGCRVPYAGMRIILNNQRLNCVSISLAGMIA
jgi:hypothetical protein